MRARTEDLRQRAVRVGARLFAKNSYAATTTREISKAIGITNGTFHHHFATKEDLQLAICERSFSRIARANRTAIEGVDDDVERLRAMIVAYISVLVEDKYLHKTAVVDMRALTGENLARAEAAVDDVRGAILEVVRTGQGHGAFRTDLAAKDLVLMLVNLVTWSLWTEPKAEITTDVLEAVVATVFLDGAAPAAYRNQGADAIAADAGG
jgi:AcrR family transcriptional regulator